MTTPQAVHHSLLRPCVLHILRAAGYHSTRPSVLDTLTDLAARYMYLLAQSTMTHATINHTELGVTIQDVRMAMQDCGAMAPEKSLEDQDFDEEEDMSGVEDFVSWATGGCNREIRRVALEGGDGAKEDYLTGLSQLMRAFCRADDLKALKKKHSTTDEDSRYNGTILGKAPEPRTVNVEGGDISSVREWAERLKTSPKTISTTSSRRQSSVLSSLGDQMMEDMEFS